MDGFRSPAASPKNETNAAVVPGGQRQPPGGSQTDAASFSDHTGKTRMTQGFFRRLQCCILSSSLYMDDAIRLQTNAGQAGCKKVWTLQHPHNRTPQAREDSRDEQSSGTGMFYFGSPAGDFMQAPTRQPTPRQMLVDCCHPEGYTAPGRRAAAGNLFDLAPERIQDIRLG
jgi:hypothetical protein